MKTSFATLIAVLLALFSFGQIKQGSVRYLVKSNWVKMMESCDYLSKEQRERVSYMWGNESEWKSFEILYIDSTYTKYEESEEKAERETDGYAWRKEEYYLYRDYAKMQIHDIIKFTDKVYIIEDTLIPQSWKILNDIKEVCGHICMNASYTDTVKDQKIVAWFALDIPLAAGPDRYSGLPGLILEIDINNGARVYTADKIDTVLPEKVMEFPAKQKGKHIKESDYQEKIAKFVADRKAEKQPYFWGIRY